MNLKKYKENPDVELIFTTWIETEDAGFGFSLNEEELTFIKEISNRYDFFFVINENLVPK